MIRILFSVFFCLIFSLSVFSQEKSSYELSVKGSVIQGSALFLTVKSADSDDITASASFRGKKADFVKFGNRLKTTVPVALDSPEGAYKLTVEIFKENKKAELFERIVKVKAHTYGKQQLWLSDSQLSKYDDPQADKDNDDILKALSFHTDGIEWNNRFIQPTEGYISTLFGLKRFYNNDPEPEFHKGLDISAPLGQKVYSSQNGIVRMARRNLVLHGDTVVIDHGRGIGTIYLHMNSISVKEGDFVKQGQTIGTVGNKGASTGPHLHWATYSNATAIDPKQLINMPLDWLEKTGDKR